MGYLWKHDRIARCWGVVREFLELRNCKHWGNFEDGVYDGGEMRSISDYVLEMEKS